MTPATATYVYCIVASARKPSLARVPPGLAGAGRARLLEISDSRRRLGAEPNRGRNPRSADRLKRWLVVADVPLAKYGETAISKGLTNLAWVSRIAVAHEAMVEAFVRAPAVLPMKLFTIFSSDERALAYAETDRRRIDRLIDRVSGQHEWGIRLTMQSVLPPVRRAGVARQRPGRQDGAGYLTRKKALRDAVVERATHARETAAGLYDELEPHASAAHRRRASELPVQRGPLLLDAVFLVPVERESTFRRLVERRARSLTASGYHVALSGPWPPYGFVQD